MIERSSTKSKGHFDMSKPVGESHMTIDEKCCICEKPLPNEVPCLRRKENQHIICVFCLMELAKTVVTEDE